MFSPFSLRILHRNCDRQDERRFSVHPVLGIPGLRSLELLFHPFPVFPDGNDERHLHPAQKPDHLPGGELPIKADYVHPETLFGDPAEAPGAVPDLRDPLMHRVHVQRYLPVLVVT